MYPHRVIFCLRGGVGGVDVFSCNLIEELIRRGVDSKIVLTTTNRKFIPSDVPVDQLSFHKKETWPSRWRRMIQYLESQAPCIFVPNYDFNYSCISPKLSEKIMIVGIVHSDEENYYADSERLGKYWNGIVAVSETIKNHLASRNGFPLQSITTIPYGVPLPKVAPKKTYIPEVPLKVIYVGRLLQIQKRILDVPKILARLKQRNINIEFSIIGDGPERDEVLQQCEGLLEEGRFRYLGPLQNREVLQQMETQDVILLTSEYEGLPICILEAMSRGCIPIVTEIRSGIPELISDGQNGFVVGMGDVDAFADRMNLLQNDLTLRRSMSAQASNTISERFDVKRMADDYLQLFEKLQEQADRGNFHRPKNKIIIPPELHLSWKQYLPLSVRLFGIYCRRVFRRITRTETLRSKKNKGAP